MSEDVYATPDLTKKVRYGQAGEVEMEKRGDNEDRGEREERIVDIYVTADDLDLDPDPGTQQDAGQKNTAREQNADSAEPKKNGFKHTASAVCLGLLCLLLLAGIIGLVIYYSDLIKKNNDLTKDRDQIHSRYNNLTKDLDEMQSRYDNLTEQKANLQTRFEQLESRYNNLTSSDCIKRCICESSGFTFDGGVCYYISTETKTWEESRQYCRDNQSDLMVIKSQEKQDLVKRLNKRVWLGLTDREVEGSFKWIDGTALTTPTYWINPQPDNFGEDPGEDCVDFLIWHGTGWNDFTCSHTNQWICERVMS